MSEKKFELSRIPKLFVVPKRIFRCKWCMIKGNFFTEKFFEKNLPKCILYTENFWNVFLYSWLKNTLFNCLCFRAQEESGNVFNEDLGAKLSEKNWPETFFFGRFAFLWKEREKSETSSVFGRPKILGGIMQLSELKEKVLLISYGFL